MKKDDAARFLFVNPFTISHCKSLSIEDRARALLERLLVATANQIVLAPCNVDSHWILTVIEPHKGHVYLLDSLYHRNRDIPWKAAVDNAMSIFNAHNGKKIKNSAKWDIIKGPKQPGSTECGFFVMRYMKDIVEGFERADNISLPSLFTNVA